MSLIQMHHLLNQAWHIAPFAVVAFLGGVLLVEGRRLS